jgi:DNA polymerase III epsilon subunit family exonuclease
MPGIWDHIIADAPVAVIDFETTGLYAGPDRVVEAAVVRVDRDGQPELAFDSLIRPNCNVGATFIHGITNADVADAPTFAEVAGLFVEAIAGCVIAAYNVSFDSGFLQHELSQVGIKKKLPQMCLMYMRPLLDLGRVVNLGEACRQHRVKMNRAHSAAGDALASAQLWLYYRNTMTTRGLTSFRDLANHKNYRFTYSFQHDPLNSVDHLNRGPVKSRNGWNTPNDCGRETPAFSMAGK